MPRKGLWVKVNPEVLKWAWLSAGQEDIRPIAKRLGIHPNTVQAWEQGERSPTLRALEKLATFYKRPLATFLLPDPPKEPPLPTDFRILPGERKPSLSKETRLSIRSARRIQSLTTELIKAIGRQPAMPVGKAAPTEDPETVAIRERERLQITVEEQLAWPSDYAAFAFWREALESLNIITLQASMPVNEARGFSLSDGLSPVIVVNSSDSIRARIFTLFHEYAHLLLGTSGICLPEEASHITGNDNLERQDEFTFCDPFAATFLVPTEALKRDEEAKLIASRQRMSASILDSIAGRFKVSRRVILRRLLNCGLISRQLYGDKLLEEKRQEEDTLLERQRKEKKKRFGLSPARRCLLINGHLFASLVYPIDHFPSLWTNLDILIRQNRLISSTKVYKELSKVEDEVFQWMKAHKSLLRELDEEQIAAAVQVVRQFPRLVDPNKEGEDADPFAIALALVEKKRLLMLGADCAVVSSEKSSSGSQKIPDACQRFEVKHFSVVQVMRNEGWTY